MKGSSGMKTQEKEGGQGRGNRGRKGKRREAKGGERQKFS